MSNHSYHDSKKSERAVEVYEKLKKFLIDQFGDDEVHIIHLAACLLEEVTNRSLPRDEIGDRLVISARTIAPYILDEIYEEQKAQKDLEPFEKGKFVVPGNDEIH